MRLLQYILITFLLIFSLSIGYLGWEIIKFGKKLENTVSGKNILKNFIK